MPTTGAALLAVLDAEDIVQADLLRLGTEVAPTLLAEFLAVAPAARLPRLLLLAAAPDNETVLLLRRAGYAVRAEEAAGALYARAEEA